MKLKNLLFLTYSVIVIGVIALGVTIVLIVNNQNKLTESYENKYKSYLRADELRQSSDDLTRFARSFVSTGDEKYLEWYNNILAIRNGEAPRPVDYHRPYWDLVLKPGEKPRPDNGTASLNSIMKELGFTEEEFALLNQATQNSDDLVKTETKAINMVRSIDDQSSGQMENGESKRDTAINLMFNDQYHANKKKIMQPIVEFYERFEARTSAQVKKYHSKAETLLIIALTIAGILVVLSITVWILVSRSTQKQIGGDPRDVKKIADRIADGDLDIKLEGNGAKSTGIYASMEKMVDSLKYKADLIEKISQKDLSIEVQKDSDKDGLGESLIVMKESLNELLGQVNSSVEQVNSGAEQVSKASQDLSQGATEQASSLEEITSSTTEVNSQSKQNAENATEANALAKKASEDAESGNAQMKELVEAMNKINASSDEINKVVKVIDDIAFQINLLALNANVEAARAGKYGKGFAVVAEEVRNLAVRAADAVKETSQMVEESITNIKQGNGLVEKTAEQLVNINEGAGKVADFLGEIALASKEQAQAIEQITNGLDQVDQVTQANTASAEESASASEELASQAQQLRSMVAQFKLDDRYSGSGARLLTQGSHLNQGQGQRSTGRDHVPQRQAGMGDTSGQQSGGGARSRGYGNGNQETGVAPVKPEEQISLDDDFDRF